MKKILFVGSGGHYNSVIDSIDFEYKGYIWEDGQDENIIMDNGIQYYHLCFGDLENRKRMIEKFESYKLTPINIIDKTAIISENVILGIGNFIGKNVVVNSHTKIGSHNIINTASVIEHDCVITDNNHIAPTSCLLGGVSIGSNNFIGAKAVIKNGIYLGSNNTIGASVFLRKNLSNNVIHFQR